MSSLRHRLLLGIIPGVGLALALGIGAVYVLTRAWLYQELDRGLAERSASLRMMISEEGGRLEFDWLDYDEGPPGFEPGVDYYLIENAETGDVAAASPGLAEWRLLDLDWTPSEAGPRDAALPGYREGRSLVTRFHARVDLPDEDEPDDAPDPFAGSERPGAASTDGKAGEGTPLKVFVARVDTVAPILAAFRRAGAALWAVSVALAGFVSWRVIRRSLRPLDCLQARIERLDGSAGESRIDVPGLPSELAPVASELNRLLDRVDKTLARERTLTSNVAHELRTPIAGILSILEVTLSRLRSPREYQESSQECFEIAKRMHWLVSNLLSVARIEAKNVRLQRRTFDLGKTLVEWWEPFSIRAKQKRLAVRWEIAPEMIVDTDPEFLRVVVENLFDNAVSYTPEGGFVRIVADPQGAISVANETVELKPEIAERAFDPFWRSSETREDAGAHTGLGLSLCRKIIELLGGRIHAAVRESDTLFVVRVEIG